MTNIFLTASRAKLRFSSEKTFPGINQTMLTTEQLWDIPLDAKSRVSINSLYIEADTKLKESQVSGLVAKPTKGNDTLLLQLAVLKEIFTIRTAEQEIAKAAKAKAEKRQKIIDALADAENKEFEGKSPEELRKMLEEL